MRFFPFSKDFLGSVIDKLQLAGQSLGQVFNCMYTMQLPCYETKQHNLKLKLLGSLPFDIVLPTDTHSCRTIFSCIVKIS
jgi:hypothetical protein